MLLLICMVDSYHRTPFAWQRLRPWLVLYAVMFASCLSKMQPLHLPPCAPLRSTMLTLLPLFISFESVGFFTVTIMCVQPLSCEQEQCVFSLFPRETWKIHTSGSRSCERARCLRLICSWVCRQVSVLRYVLLALDISLWLHWLQNNRTDNELNSTPYSNTTGRSGIHSAWRQKPVTGRKDRLRRQGWAC